MSETEQDHAPEPPASMADEQEMRPSPLPPFPPVSDSSAGVHSK